MSVRVCGLLARLSLCPYQGPLVGTPAAVAVVRVRALIVVESAPDLFCEQSAQTPGSLAVESVLACLWDHSAQTSCLGIALRR